MQHYYNEHPTFEGEVYLRYDPYSGRWYDEVDDSVSEDEMGRMIGITAYLMTTDTDLDIDEDGYGHRYCYGWVINEFEVDEIECYATNFNGSRYHYSDYTGTYYNLRDDYDLNEEEILRLTGKSMDRLKAEADKFVHKLLANYDDMEKVFAFSMDNTDMYDEPDEDMFNPLK